MKRRLAGILLLLAGAALIGPFAVCEGSARLLLRTCGCLMIWAGVAVWITNRRHGRGGALMLLNWFVPWRYQRGSKHERGARTAARVFHSSLSRLRHLLTRAGPSFAASPLRRLFQGASYLLFGLLFFYVGWPYTAHPVPPGQLSRGWQFAEVDQQDGAFRLMHRQPPDWLLQGDRAVYVRDESNVDQASSYVGAFRVVSHAVDTVTLMPADELAAERCDALLVSIGPWSLCESEPNRWPSHYTDDLARKEWVSAELFLALDPLVSVSTAVAARSWVETLLAAAVILVICLLIPRGFCSYVCPLGTTIDLFDWAVTRHVRRWQVVGAGWWVQLKYYLLAGILVCALCGVLVSGFFAAIPVLTRAFVFLFAPLQIGFLRGWHLVPDMHIEHIVSLVMFSVVLALGFLRPRFWCRYVCPSGAVFSLGNLLRVTERKVESTCIRCNKCVEVCPFDAIKSDFTTRGMDCTFCQTCGGVCPAEAIKFVERWNRVSLKVEEEPFPGGTLIGRRGFLSLAVASTGALVSCAGIIGTSAARGTTSATAWSAIRPPGSVPESEFLQLCIRCGECFQVCPNNVLQPEGFQQGFAGLWTPLVVPDWAGCESSCNACGQVCPTGAIRALSLDEKRRTRIGLAVVDPHGCLPLANRQACQLCVDECNGAGYRAIEFARVHTQADATGNPVEGTGFLGPVISAGLCVGCGLCQTRCHAINVRAKKLLTSSAIVIEAGAGKEDRLSFLRTLHEMC
ncbi:MAG: 4Fe-4S binding protein [Pirellulaceae bacterium]